MLFNDIEYPTDSQGYLLKPEMWNKNFANFVAANDKITLNEEHWQVINFVRDFYDEFNTSPSIRALVKAMQNKYGKENISSASLQRLFPQGTAKQSTKIAGLPKPARCI